jgi:sugar phosphate isomerase/epimerase
MIINLSISHLGWRKDENKNVIKILKKNRIKHIDIVLGRYFDNIEKLDNKKILNLKAFWKKKGIKIYGMQSILYGYEDFNIFKSDHDRDKLLDVIKKINRIAKNLGVRFITFGCPKNRFKFKNQSDNLAVNFFKLISKNLNKNVTLCIEPIPKIYNNNFLTNTKDVLKFLKKVNKKNILCQLDMSAIKINNDDLNYILKFKKFIGHIHISDINLGKIQYNEENKKIISFFIKNFKKKVFAIEILGNKKSNLERINKSIININQIINEF